MKQKDNILSLTMECKEANQPAVYYFDYHTLCGSSGKRCCGKLPDFKGLYEGCGQRRLFGY